MEVSLNWPVPGESRLFHSPSVLSFPIPVDYAPLRIAQSIPDDLPGLPAQRRRRKKKWRIEAAARIGTGSRDEFSSRFFRWGISRVHAVFACASKSKYRA